MKIFQPPKMNHSKKPSIFFKILRSVVKSGKLKRGYGWLLQHVPAFVWGGESIIVQTAIGGMALPVNDPGSAGILLFGKILHETNETSLIRSLCKGCSVAIDIGSHSGWYACLIWSVMTGEKKVYAFEPNPYIYAFLLENTENYAGIIPFQTAIGDINKPITFYCAKSSNLSSVARHVGTPITVNSMRLDTFCKDEGLLGKLDFIKCDVEGGELSVLQGARIVRSLPNSPIWMLEVDKGFLNEAGISTDEVDIEIHSINNPINIFYLNSKGTLVKISHLSETQVPNVFIVPDIRLEQFYQATAY